MNESLKVLTTTFVHKLGVSTFSMKFLSASVSVIRLATISLQILADSKHKVSSVLLVK